MFSNSVLNVIISLLFIFLLYSLLATALQEALANIFQSRANTLHKGIKQMLTNKNLKEGNFKRFFKYLFCGVSDFFQWLKFFFVDKEAKTLYDKFYHHPIVKNYGENAVFSKPSYLSAENFASVLIDTIKNLDSDKQMLTADYAMIKDILFRYSKKESSESKKNDNSDKNTDINNNGNGEVAIDQQVIECETFKILNYHLNEAAGDLNVFRHRLEKWFNDSMDRVSGWYKRHTQFLLLLLGFGLASSLNIDTIAITKYLFKHKQDAETIANLGEAAIKNPSLKPSTDSITGKALQEISKQNESVSSILGMGWGDYNKSKNVCEKIRYVLFQTFFVSFSRFFGFLITALAISLGAPFWFDLLSKFVNLRSSGRAIRPSGSSTQNNSSDDSQIDG